MADLTQFPPQWRLEVARVLTRGWLDLEAPEVRGSIRYAVLSGELVDGEVTCTKW